MELLGSPSAVVYTLTGSWLAWRTPADAASSPNQRDRIA
jgi:hypothetical protein